MFGEVISIESQCAGEVIVLLVLHDLIAFQRNSNTKFSTPRCSRAPAQKVEHTRDSGPNSLPSPTILSYSSMIIRPLSFSCTRTAHSLYENHSD